MLPEPAVTDIQERNLVLKPSRLPHARLLQREHRHRLRKDRRDRDGAVARVVLRRVDDDEPRSRCERSSSALVLADRPKPHARRHSGTLAHRSDHSLVLGRRETGTLDADDTVRDACSCARPASGLRWKPTGPSDAGGTRHRSRSHHPDSARRSEFAFRGHGASARWAFARQLLAQPRERPAGAAGQTRDVPRGGVGWLQGKREGASTGRSGERQRGTRSRLVLSRRQVPGSLLADSPRLG
jgi:hypothetical protein